MKTFLKWLFRIGLCVGALCGGVYSVHGQCATLAGAPERNQLIFGVEVGLSVLVFFVELFRLFDFIQ